MNLSRFVLSVMILFLALSSGARVEPGDSVSKMRLELGEPTAEILRGETTIYSYPQGGVHVRDGRVVRLSDGFYGAADQIVRQTRDGAQQRSLHGNGMGSDGQASSASGEDRRSGASGLQWFSHWEAAQERAAQDQRPLLVVFSRSEDCAPCREWEAHFRDPEFVGFARGKLVLLWVEPEEVDGLDPSIAPPGMLHTGSVPSLPALRLLSPDLRELGQLSYRPMTVVEFVERLDALLKVEAEGTGAGGLKNGGDELGDTLDRLMWMEGISNGALLLSAQIFAGCVLTFLLIRRLMRK